MNVYLVPVDFATAAGFVEMWHRHNKPPVSHKFSIGAVRQRESGSK